MWAVSIESKYGLTDRSSCTPGAGNCNGRCCGNIDCVCIHKSVEKQQTSDLDRILRLALNFCLFLCGDLRLLNRLTLTNVLNLCCIRRSRVVRGWGGDCILRVCRQSRG